MHYIHAYSRAYINNRSRGEPGQVQSRFQNRRVVSRLNLYVCVYMCSCSYCPELPVQYLGDITTGREPQVGHELRVRVDAVYIVHGRQVVQDGVVV